LTESWLLDLVRDQVRPAANPPAVEPISLPPRELAVLRELVTGAPDKVIADRLAMACSTVRTQVTRLRAKFEADSRAQLVANPIKAGALTA
jgi:DNA-binding NarL/FixJ family response regulator